MKTLLNFVLSLFESDRQRIERYLANSKDLADLEYRLKEIDKPHKNFYL
jgi:hypothetical protein